MTILYIIPILVANSFHLKFASTSYPSGAIPCKLYKYTNADCSHRRLIKVPRIDDNTIETLDLSYNELGNLSSKAHFERFDLLKVLNLGNNQITGFDDVTFQGLISLLTLDLSNHKVTEISGEPFKHLSSLRKLQLQNPKEPGGCKGLSFIASSSFNKLFNLRWLDLHCNQLTSIPADIFVDLKKLQYVNLSNNYNLRQISARFPPSLQILNLAFLLPSIEPGIFMNLTNLLDLKLTDLDGSLLQLLTESPLQKLAIIWNRVYIPDLEKTFKSLMKFKKITSFTFFAEAHILWSLHTYLTYFQLDAPLKHLSLIHFNCAPLKSTTFQPLARWNVSLTHLEIIESWCAFPLQETKEIKDSSFCWLTNLQKLTISNHQLSQLSQGAFNGLTKLQELDLSRNQISVIPPKLFHVFTNSLKYLDLRNNLLSGGFKFFESFPSMFTIMSLVQLNIGHNPIVHSFVCSDCDRLPNFSVLNMEYSDFMPDVYGSNRFSISIQSRTLLKLQLARKKDSDGYLNGMFNFKKNLNLQYVDLSNWFLEYNVSELFGSTSNLTYLDISGSNLYDHTQSTVYYYRLDTLKLARNKINTTREIAFLYAPELTTLDLSHNFVSTIHNEYVSMLKNLFNIDLEDNRLLSLKQFHNLNQLQQVNLGQNFLTAIPQTFLTRQLIALDTSGNPYDCSRLNRCLLEPFQDWIFHNSVTFIPPNGTYQCASNDVSMFSVNLKYCKYLVPIYICASFVGLLFTGLMVFLLTKYHWHIRYKLFLLIRQRQYRRALDDRENEDPVENANEMRPLAPIYYRRSDCYVVYAPQDKDWVNNELVANIEDYEPEPFSLCMKERGDIPAGGFLLNSIVHGIMHSRRTIVVLTERFMADGMCDYQLQIAQNRLIKEGRDVLILLYLEDVPDRKKTLLLRQIMCRNTAVLKWPRDPLGRDLFWRCLRVELKKPVRIDRRFEA